MLNENPFDDDDLDRLLDAFLYDYHWSHALNKHINAILDSPTSDSIPVERVAAEAFWIMGFRYFYRPDSVHPYLNWDLVPSWKVKVLTGEVNELLRRSDMKRRRDESDPVIGMIVKKFKKI